MTTATKKKTHVLLISNYFLKGHPRSGEPTNFEYQLLNCFKPCPNGSLKIHTIRKNYDYWKPRIDEINAGEAVLSIRKWTGKPYNSKQQEIILLEKAGIQKVKYNISGDDSYCFVFNDGFKNQIFINDLIKNDGLDRKSFEAWFQDMLPFEGAIIHFTNFRY